MRCPALCLTGLLALLPGPASAQGLEGLGFTPNRLTGTLQDMGAVPCADSSLTCVTIEVPRDHFANDPDPTIQVTYGVQLATEPSLGTILYAVGGPGMSGLAVAEDYMASFDPEVLAMFDIVFFDQRGIGPVTGIDCPLAQGVYDRAALDPRQGAAVLAVTETFVSDCVSEMDHADLLLVVDTEQAIRDAELFRQAIGVPKYWLMGESYGTQFVQAYATAFPDAVQGVLLDGVVDLTLSYQQFAASNADAAERILARVFAECALLPACAADMGGDAAAVYDGLAARLAEAPVEVAYPMPDGSTAPRRLTGSMLETVAFTSLYDRQGRTDLLRALAAVAQEDLVPLIRLTYALLSIDPETDEGLSDPSWYGAAFYAITCTDYAESSGDPLADARAVIADAAARAKENPRLPRAYFAERVVCALWPGKRAAVPRPAAYAGGDWPTLVMNGDMDPITPAAMAYAVADGARNTALVMMEGGPHVIWGRGNACPDALVAELLTQRHLPEAGSVQLCQQPVLADYVPLTLPDPGAASPIDMARAVLVETGHIPELYNWYGWDPITVGCPHGGTISAQMGDTDTTYDYAGCAIWPGVRVDGMAVYRTWDTITDGVSFFAKVSGVVEGEFLYTRGDLTEAEGIVGHWAGQPFDTPRPVP